MGLLQLIVGAMLGALAAIALERHKHATDRRGVASAIAGEISAWIYGVEMRGQVEEFTAHAVRVRSGQAGQGPYAWIDTESNRDPVLTAYINRIGVLGGNLPERVARFYTILESLRSDLRRLAGPELVGKPDAAADVIEKGLELWKQAATDGKKLVQDLQAVASAKRNLSLA